MTSSASGDVPEGYFPGVLPAASMPLAPPPPGVTANLDHPQSNSFRVKFAAGICIPVILILASLRAYHKLAICRSRTWDDYTFMLATLWTIIYLGLTIGLLSKGLFGTHIWELRVDDLKNTPFLLVLVLESLYGPFIWLIKLSMFLMYLHFFAPHRYMHYLVWGGITVTGLFYFSSMVASLALCAPRGSETYIISFATWRCHRSKALAVATGVMNVLSDLYLLILPIRETMRLHNTLRKRIGVLAVFMTGFMALIASILGLYYRVRVNTMLDNTWKVMPVYLSIHHEPALKAYFGRFIRTQSSQGTAHRMKRLGRPAQGSTSRAADSQRSSRHGHKASDDSKIQLCSLSSETDLGDGQQKARAPGAPENHLMVSSSVIGVIVASLNKLTIVCHDLQK
ncbi:MAG: hypothetical protein Q9181_002026 [Wetmoreana brouardii]